MSFAQLDPVEILLVEDNDDDAELTARALRRRKLTNRLYRARDGAEALDFLFGRGAFAPAEGKGSEAERRSVHSSEAVGQSVQPVMAPRVVLLDLKLPKVDGMEVLRALKADDRLKGVPVVVLTSSKEDRDLEEAYRLGVNSYIVKPVVFEKFVEAVEQLGMYWTLLNERPLP